MSVTHRLIRIRYNDEICNKEASKQKTMKERNKMELKTELKRQEMKRKGKTAWRYAGCLPLDEQVLPIKQAN
jgi:hypothetical protein